MAHRSSTISRPAASMSIARPTNSPSTSSTLTSRPSVSRPSRYASVTSAGSPSVRRARVEHVGRVEPLAERSCSVGSPTDIEPEPHHHGAVGGALGQDPGELGAVDQQVVGPLEADATARQAASRRASPPARPGEPRRLRCPSVGRNRIEASRFAPGGAAQRRSRRPRPAVWCAVRNTVRPGAPAAAAASRSALVLPVSGMNQDDHPRRARSTGRQPAGGSAHEPGTCS